MWCWGRCGCYVVSQGALAVVGIVVRFGGVNHNTRGAHNCLNAYKLFCENAHELHNLINHTRQPAPTYDHKHQPCYQFHFFS